MNIIETMKQALAALEDRQSPHSIRMDIAISCLRAAIDAAENHEPVAWMNEAAAVMSRFIQLTAHPLEDEWGEVAADGIRLLNINPAPTQSDSEQAKDAALKVAREYLESIRAGSTPAKFLAGRGLSAIDAAMKVGSGGTAEVKP